mmetsp:Transcript_15604/g.29434  ORF Transcript_15604/g.29434 Transcript_15604/m.29434 type:complete len:284 (-) Transcript_15604:97-948(-)
MINTLRKCSHSTAVYSSVINRIQCSSFSAISSRRLHNHYKIAGGSCPIASLPTATSSSNNMQCWHHGRPSLHPFHQSTKRYKTSTKEPCPFQTLRISKESTYKSAKTSFLKIAMNNHPDVLNQRLDKNSPHYANEMKKAVDLFMKARKAFESLVEADDGSCVLRVEVEAINAMMTNEQFDAWFSNETGYTNPYQVNLDPKTMREVADATEAMGGGLDRDGGMWTLASMVTNSVKAGKNAGSILRLEAGSIREDNSLEDLDGTLRRRRRRPGATTTTGRKGRIL